MKRILNVLLSLCMLMSCLTSGVITASAEEGVSMENIVYISADAKGKNGDGTKSKPFGSVEEARDFLRTKNLDADNRGIIYLRGGQYHLTDSIELAQEDSYITIAAYNGEKAEITGASTLSPDKFKRLSAAEGEQYSSKTRIPRAIRSKIYVYDLGAEGIPVGKIHKSGFNWKKQIPRPELVTDGELQTLAQYPNDGSFLKKEHFGVYSEGDKPRNSYFDKSNDVKTYEEMIAMKGPVFKMKEALPESARKWAGAYDTSKPYTNVTGDMPEVNPLSDNTKYETDGWLSGYMANTFANDNVHMYSMKEQDGEYYIYCRYPSLYGAGEGPLKMTAINLLCELDSEGEYYIDRYNNNNVLYYYPKDGQISGKHITLNSFDKPLLTMDKVNSVQLNGISFTGTINNGIKMTDCENCTITGCELYNIGMDAIKMGDNNGAITADPSYRTFGGGHNNRVVDCVIHDMGHGGVYAAGGDRKSLERGNHVVENCEFYNVSRLEGYTPAIYLEGMGNTARYNYIHDAPHVVIQLMGNDMLVTHNKIVNTCSNVEDMAPIYIGRGITWFGNEISYNYVDKVSPSKRTNFGVYMDDLCAGVMVHHNIFNKVGGSAIYSNTGYASYITDNIAIDSTMHYYRLLTCTSRPIPNEKTHKYRFYDTMRTYEEAVASGDESRESTKGYWNTQENIDKWCEYYNNMYNNLPEYSKNPDYAFDLSKKYFPADGESSRETWLSNDSVIAHANMTLVRNITATPRTDEVDMWLRGSFYEDTNPSDPAIYDSKRHRAKTAAELGLDTTTGKISYDGSLAKDENYGTEWVDAWNENFSVAEAGVQESVDKTHLWRKIAEAESKAGQNSKIRGLLKTAHTVAADGTAEKADVDSAYSALVEELRQYGSQYELNITEKTVDKGTTLNLEVYNLLEGDTVEWSSSNKAVASVDENGAVSAKAIGKAVITAKVGQAELKCTVYVEIDRTLSAQAMSMASGYGSEQGNEKDFFRIGGTVSGVVTAYNNASIKDGQNGKDVKVGFARFDLGTDASDMAKCELKLSGGSAFNGRNGKINAYVAVADTNTTVADGKTSVGDSWTAIPWNNRPQLLTELTEGSPDAVISDKEIVIDVTEILRGKTGIVTLVVLGEIAEAGVNAEKTFDNAELMVSCAYRRPEISKVELTDNDDETRTVSEISIYTDETEDTKAYIAVYTEDGVLKSIQSADIENMGDNNIPVDILLDKTDTLKVFLWKDMQPVARKAYTVTPKPEATPEPTPEPIYYAEFTMTDNEGNIVPNAKISVSGTTDEYEDIETELVSDEEGKAKTELPNGEYTYTIIAADYVIIRDTAFNIKNATAELNVELEKVTAPKHTVQFNCLDMSNEQLSDAAVTVTNPEYDMVVEPNEDGTYSLTNGTYLYEVVKDGYITQKAEFTVADTDKSIDIVMPVAYIAEDFNRITGSWDMVTEGKGASASIKNKVLSINLDQNKGSGSVTKTFDETVSRQYKALLEFDWKPEVDYAAKKGRESYLYISDSNDMKLLGLYQHGMQKEQYIIDGETKVEFGLQKSVWYHIKLEADFTTKNCKLHITDDTGKVLADNVVFTTTAANISKMSAVNEYSAAPMSIDNFMIYEMQ